MKKQDYLEKEDKKRDKNIKFLEAINIIINKIKSKDKKIISKIILFFLYLLILIIIIKIPFIYTRDMIYNLFNNLFQKDWIYILWNLLFEILYATTSIIISIKLIKSKALEIEKTSNRLHS